MAGVFINLDSLSDTYTFLSGTLVLFKGISLATYFSLVKFIVLLKFIS